MPQFLTSNLFMVGVVIAALLFITVFLAICFRIVVPTNAVHIVQNGRKTISYGKDMEAGNIYYRWPSWVPYFGVLTSNLPLSVFPISLKDYPAFDIGRVPFVLDVLGFFRISDSNMAAERVSTFPELQQQLSGIMQGAVRSILAKAEIEQILGERAVFGQKFTDEVQHQLLEWGVAPVKNLELMDIRDASQSEVIHNIMAKKKSYIEMQSRVEVANNTKTAQEAEITATQSVLTRKQEAEQAVGERTAQAQQAVGIANEQSKQAVQEQARTTAEKNMAVTRVNQVRQAEITKDVQVVAAEQRKATDIIQAEGQKQQVIIIAEGNLSQMQLHAQGVEAEGIAQGVADTAIQMATVTPQITLAKEIGENTGYQTYLVSVKGIEANQAVGIAQADALKAADIKIIANAGDPVGGISTVRELLSSKGGQAIGAALEGLRNTETGAQVLSVITGDKPQGKGK